MEEEINKVTLHGMWASTYSKRVELALSIKGVPFEYVEEDLINKSPSLLQYNPVHKKVPVLVHNGKSICESMVIVEYIDETWKNEPRLLPDDPYKRARVRFWADFFHQKVLPCLLNLVISEGDRQNKCVGEFQKKLKILEDNIDEMFVDDQGASRIKEGRVGMLDIIALTVLGAYKAQEEVIGFKIIDQNKNPKVFSWVNALLEQPKFKELVPPHDKVVSLLLYLKQNNIKLAPN
ncbi:glutathione S-transferase U9 [Impatiens glandulifera]|uniref:glutathione S-transferase U9 n=1 Tax=Impatiens glandulifera TaxID=253017 RepID=UPI001FB16F4D|nr:glutathione S-transferase U9 [Impatiens glandulifera]